MHELPNSRWFVGDFVRTDRDGYAIFLVELRPGAEVSEVSTSHLARANSGVRTYSTKGSAKRAAQRMIELGLDEDRR